MALDMRRMRSLRVFEILLRTGERVRVVAHFHENNSPAGHLNFYTYNAEGRSMVRQSFNSEMWLTLTEIGYRDNLFVVEN